MKEVELPRIVEGEKDAAQIKAAIRDCFAQIDQSFKRMDASQQEIERLKSETRVILGKLKAA